MLFNCVQWSIEFSDYSSLSVFGSIIKNAFGIVAGRVTEVVLVTGNDDFDD